MGTLAIKEVDDLNLDYSRNPFIDPKKAADFYARNRESRVLICGNFVVFGHMLVYAFAKLSIETISCINISAFEYKTIITNPNICFDLEV